MGNYISPNLVTNGLVMALDASNPNSYPGSGTTWYDLTSNKYDWTLNALAFTAASTSNPAHFNFEGTYGHATRATDVPAFSNATLMCFTSILNSTSNWRTLLRSVTNDHEVIVQFSSNTLGFYDNNTNSFISGGFDITNIPSVYTKFNCLTFRFAQSSPYWQFQFNENSTVYSITDPNAIFNTGFGYLGGVTSSQYWGKIAAVFYYNRHLTQSEINQNYSAFRGRYGV